MTEHDDFVIGDLADTEGGEDARDADEIQQEPRADLRTARRRKR